MAGLGQPKYRAGQLGDALYKQRVGSLEEITTLPVELRERMRDLGYAVGLPEIVQAAKSVDGTERYLVKLGDGETVETVWMPDGDGGERGDGSVAAEEEERDDRGATEPTLSDGTGKDGPPGSVVVPGSAGGYKRATICIFGVRLGVR